MNKLGIYIHIPFCKRKCNYCDFYSCTDIQLIKEYIDALCTHIEKESKLYKDYEIDTIFFGGGTPSLVEPNEFEALMDIIKRNYRISPSCEFSLEANPATLSEEKLLCYKKNGVNRLSIGLQSTFDDELKMLGRIHTYSEFLDNFKLARECGFENISVDVMYSLPEQKREQLLKTLERVCGLSPEHISSYCLKIEEKTPFGKIKDKLALPSEDEEYYMYISMCEMLEKNGYSQYEISNFSKSGYESKHNLKYWQSLDYVGFGPAAHSYIDGKRYYYKDDIKLYIEQVKNGSLPEKILDKNDENVHVSARISKEDEYVMLKMRLSAGMNIKEFFDRFDKDFLSTYPRVEKYVKSGHIALRDGAYCFTYKGFFVSNYILTDILNFNDE